MGGAQHMAYHCTIFDSLDSLDAQAWDAACAAAGASVFLDRRFLAAVCAGMKNESQYWFVIVNDDVHRATDELVRVMGIATR